MKSAVVSRIFICLLAMAPLLGIFAALGEATLLAVAALLAIAAAPRSRLPLCCAAHPTGAD